MKHLKRINEYENKHTKFSIGDVKIFQPTDKDMETLSGIIMNTFTNSEIGVTDDQMITVHQDGEEITGSFIDWVMAISDVYSTRDGAEGVMRLFFWQGNSPLEELIDIIEESKE